MGLALLGALHVAVEQHDVHAGNGGDIGNARAHEAGAEHADRLQLRGRHALRPAQPLAERADRDEQRADHRLGLRRAQDMGEMTRLDAQRRVHRHLQAFIDHLQDGAGAGIIVVGLAPVDGIGRRPGHHAGRRIDRAGGQAELVLVPGLLRVDAGLQARLGGLDQVGGRHDLVDQAHGLGAIGFQLVALQQHLQGVLGVGHARHALGAAGAREQADLHLGQADAQLRIVRGDAGMARQRDLEGAAEAHAVDGGDEGLAAGLQLAQHQRQRPALLEEGRHGRFRTLGPDIRRIGLARPLEHGEVGTGGKRVLARGDHAALDGGIGDDGIDRRVQVLAHGLVDDVHRLVLHVPGQERDAVGVDGKGEVLEVHDGNSPLRRAR